MHIANIQIFIKYKNFFDKKAISITITKEPKHHALQPAKNATVAGFATTSQIPGSQHVTKGNLLGRKRWPFGVRFMAFQDAVCRLSYARRKPRQHAYMKT